MKLKEAIANIERLRFLEYGPSITVVLSALRQCQREKREMWKALSARCNLNVWKGLGLYRLCGIHGLGKPMNKCTHRNCPLLKGKVKK